MQDQSNQEGSFDGYTERLVVLAVLGHKRGYPRTRVLADLEDIPREFVERAIASLERAGVVSARRARIYPSPALQRLDDLTMICI
jgi:hypothetical protein